MSFTCRPSLSGLRACRLALRFGPRVPASFAKIQPTSCLLQPRSIASSTRKAQEIFHAQAEDPNNSAFVSSLKTPPVPQTLTEKILQRYAVGLPEGKYVKSGDIIMISPHHCMTHDNSWPVATKFMSIGASQIKDPRQIVMTLDHDVQNKSEKNLTKYRQIEEFAKQQGVDFYPAGRGIGHQIMCESGYVMPGTLVVASDSHSNMYGGLSALGMAVVRSDAACVWATGRTWWQVPPVAKVTFSGVLPTGVTGKDVIVALCGLFNKDEVLNHAIEFVGSEETMQSLSVDARLTIANMTTEFGALSGVFEMDNVLQAWLRSKATMAAIDKAEGRPANERFTHAQIDRLFESKLRSDPSAKYAKYLHLDLSSLQPYVSGPNSVKIATPLNELEAQNIKVDKAYLVSCTNARASDFAAAAKVFKDAAEKNGGQVPKIADGVKFYIAAASTLEQNIMEESGDWQVLLAAGAQSLPSGCGPCIGLGTGLLEPGEVGISASNRNFKGRMGSPQALSYLASPEIVAASALSGKLSGPGWYKKPEGYSGPVYGEGDGVAENERMITADEALQKIIDQLDGMLETAEQQFGGKTPTEETTSSRMTEVYPGFPERIEGHILFADSDNINTDGIYPGKYTYQDDVSTQQMAEVCMENYDPNFASLAKPGDVLISGFNFGCGSSREQAATAILARQIPLVVAGSFGSVFGRNSINNGLVGLEVPRLVQRLREVFSATAKPTDSEITEPFGNKENQQSLDSPPPAPPKPFEKQLTRRTGWKLVWDVKKSQIEVTEGEGGKQWTEKVSEIPPNVQEIIAKGGLEKWVKAEIAST